MRNCYRSAKTRSLAHNQQVIPLCILRNRCLGGHVSTIFFLEMAPQGGGHGLPLQVAVLDVDKHVVGHAPTKKGGPPIVPKNVQEDAICWKNDILSQKQEKSGCYIIQYTCGRGTGTPWRSGCAAPPCPGFPGPGPRASSLARGGVPCWGTTGHGAVDRLHALVGQQTVWVLAVGLQQGH